MKDITKSKPATSTVKRYFSVSDLRLSKGSGNWQYDVRKHQLTVDERCAEMLGWRIRASMPLNRDDWEGLIHPDDLEEVHRCFEEHIDAVSDQYDVQFRMLHSDGHWVWVHSVGRVVERDAHLTPLLVQGVHLDISQRRGTQASTEEQFRRMRQLLAQMPGTVYELRRDGPGVYRYTYIGSHDDRTLCIPPSADESWPSLAIDIVDPLDRPTFVQRLERCAKNLETLDFRYKIKTPEAGGGTVTRWVENIARPILTEGLVSFYGFVREVSQEVRLGQDVAQLQRDLESTIAALPDFLFEFDEDGRYVKVHAPELSRLLIPPEKLMGQRYRDVLPPIVVETCDAALAVAAREGAAYGFEYPRKNGDKTLWFELSAARKIMDATGSMHFVVLVRDITARKVAESRVEQLARFDPLTGLSNRQALIDHTKHFLTANQTSDECLALMFLDLDDFKLLNESLGHHYGDLALVTVAERLRNRLGAGCAIARPGGDEFAIFIPQLGLNASEAALKASELALAIVSDMMEPLALNDKRYQLTASLGIAVTTPSSVSQTELFKQADVAQFQAKAEGRNCVRFFDERTQLAVNHVTNIEQELRKAIANNELLLYFQPVLDSGANLVGYEALVRWLHPTMGLVPPSEFIPLAEKSSLILSIGDWILDQACATLARWSGDSATRELTLAVNISAVQLRQHGFVNTIVRHLQRHRAPSARLKLEITESLMQQDTVDVISKMQTLRAVGIGFSLDDFGTGYSSLSYLRQLPISTLKIDRGFVRNICTDDGDAAITKMIIELAHSLKLTVIAEGVEEQGQYDALVAAGCDGFQGYLFGAPAPLSA